jgi:hypothetical protein
VTEAKGGEYMFRPVNLEDFMQFGKRCKKCKDYKDCMYAIYVIEDSTMTIREINKELVLNENQLGRLLKCLVHHRYLDVTKRPMYVSEFEEAVIEKLKKKRELKKLEYFEESHQGNYDESCPYARIPTKGGKSVIPKVSIYKLTRKGFVFWSRPIAKEFDYVTDELISRCMRDDWGV